MGGKTNNGVFLKIAEKHVCLTKANDCVNKLRLRFIMMYKAIVKMKTVTVLKALKTAL